jgi:RHS repeat-associated protein
MTTAAQLSENSHQGFEGIKAALCLESMQVKSNTASGMPLCLWPNGIRSRSSGKERDAETGLDNFGARYLSATQGRFLSPDPTPGGINPSDPQSWNLYSYVRNRPTRFIDTNGKWATDVHVQITTFALQGYVSAGELAQLNDRQYVMDANQSPNVQYKHAMSGGGPGNEALNNMWGFVASRMSDAAEIVFAHGGNFSWNSLNALGDAIHTVQDYTSPMHTTGDFMPMVWNGGFWPPTKWGPGLAHWEGEASPIADWSRIGFAIRLTMAAYMQANPEAAAKNGLTDETFDSQANKRINNYVNWFYQNSSFGEGQNIIREDAARQCALGNPAACD